MTLACHRTCLCFRTQKQRPPNGDGLACQKVNTRDARKVSHNANCHKGVGAPAVFSQQRLEEAGANLALTTTLALHSRIAVIRPFPVFRDLTLSSFERDLLGIPRTVL